MRLSTEAAQALADLAPQLADSTRLSKGRSLFRRGVVGHLDLGGRNGVTALVSGSRPLPYEVTISTRPAPDHVADDVATDGWVAAVPPARDIAFDCTCPDWGDPCKHAVAVLYALAELVDHDPQQLGRWRSLDALPELPPTPPSALRKGGEVIQLGAALEGLVARSNDPTLRRNAANVLARMSAGAAEPAGPPPVDQELVAFFTGGVPDSGPLLGTVALEGLRNPYQRLSITIEGVDAAPILADALAVITDMFETRW